MALRIWLLFVIEYPPDGQPRLTYWRSYRSRTGVMGRLRTEKERRGTDNMRRVELASGVSYVWPTVSISVEPRSIEAVNAAGITGWMLGGKDG